MPGGLMWPVSIMRLASSRCPVSKTSSSGSTPTSRIATAMVCRCCGRVDEDPGAHVEAAHVEAADVRAKLDHVAHAVFRTPQRAGRTGLGRVLGIVLKAGAGPCCQVDQDVGSARTDALHHLAIERAVHAGLGGLRIAHMDVDDRGAGFGGIDRGLGNLLRRDRHRRILARGVGGAGDCTRNDDLALHVAKPSHQRLLAPPNPQFRKEF